MELTLGGLTQVIVADSKALVYLERSELTAEIDDTPNGVNILETAYLYSNTGIYPAHISVYQYFHH